MDHIESRFDRVDAELALIHQDLGEIKDGLSKLEKRTKEDADVSVQEVLKLRQRVDVLERQVAQLKLAHA